MRSHRRGTRFTGQRRKLVWATSDTTTTLLATGNVANISLLADLAGNASILGCTVMRTHVRLAPVTSAPLLGETILVGLLIARQTDVADPTTAGLVVPTQTDLDWMFTSRFIASPTLTEGGSNMISIDLRAKRKIQELNQRYILSVQNSFAASQQFKVYARTLVALP